MRSDMEFWRDVRRQVLTSELSQCAAMKQYGLGWHTLKKILTPEKPTAHEAEAATGSARKLTPRK